MNVYITDHIRHSLLITGARLLFTHGSSVGSCNNRYFHSTNTECAVGIQAKRCAVATCDFKVPMDASGVGQVDLDWQDCMDMLGFHIACGAIVNVKSEFFPIAMQVAESSRISVHSSSTSTSTTSTSTTSTSTSFTSSPVPFVPAEASRDSQGLKGVPLALAIIGGLLGFFLVTVIATLVWRHHHKKHAIDRDAFEPKPKLLPTIPAAIAESCLKQEEYYDRRQQQLFDSRHGFGTYDYNGQTPFHSFVVPEQH